MKTSYRKKELQKLLDTTKSDDFSWNQEYITFSMEMVNDKQTFFEYAQQETHENNAKLKE